ncbi:MAG: hypothetical protein OCD02_13560 [Spirochaetaceae bacterium]
MKKLFTIIAVLFIALPIFSNSTMLEDTIWVISYMDGEEVVDNQIEQSFGDIDGDGIEEKMLMKMYMTFKEPKVRIYIKIDTLGTPGVLEGMGLEPTFTFTEADYTISGNFITVEGEASEFEINDNVLTLDPNKEDKMSLVPISSVDLSEAVSSVELQNN